MLSTISLYAFNLYAFTLTTINLSRYVLSGSEARAYC